VPDGIFNLLSIFTDMKEFGRLHCVIDPNKPSKLHWKCNLRQYAHHAEPLLDIFTTIEALRWALFVRNFGAVGWELHVRVMVRVRVSPRSSGTTQT